MSRIPATVRPAERHDAPALREVWSEVLRPGDREEQLRDVERVLREAGEVEGRRVMVAEYAGQVAGAVYLRVGTLSPINLEPAVFTIAPHVLPRFRRHGVGTTLMEASVRFAEDQGVGHVASAATADWRDGNRFLARLSLVPYAMLRLAPTPVMRDRLAAARPGLVHQPRSRNHRIDRVLAARRSRRGERARAAAR